MARSINTLTGAIILWIACLWAAVGGWLIGWIDVSWRSVTGLWMMVTFVWLVTSVTRRKDHEA